MITTMFVMMIVFKNGSGSSITSVTADYTSQKKCEAAIEHNRQQLTAGTVILATCTPK